MKETGYISFKILLNELFCIYCFHILVECNMKQKRIGTSHASICRHKNRIQKFYCRHRMYVTSTIPFFSKLFILCSSLIKDMAL